MAKPSPRSRASFVATTRTRQWPHPYSTGSGLAVGAAEVARARAQVFESGAAVGRIFLVDAHTGLGPSGVDTLMALGDDASLDVFDTSSASRTGRFCTERRRRVPRQGTMLP